MTPLYRTFSPKLPADLRRAVVSLVEFSEHHNRKLAPITVQRITMVVFAAWLREQDRDVTTITASEWAEALESATRCAQVLTPPDVRALQSTLVAYADRQAAEAAKRAGGG